MFKVNLQLIYLSIALTAIFFSCSDKEQVKDGLTNEIFPKVDLKDYDTITFTDQFEFIIPNELSIANGSRENSVIAYSNLVSEVSIEVCTFDKTISNTKKGIDSVFLELSESILSDVTTRFKAYSIEEQYCSRYNDRMNCYYHLHIKQNGFPEERAVSYRFVQGERINYLLIFTSLKKDADKYLDVEDVFMLSFREIKKG